jgi:lipid II:glycine glycyltransferase (peptidoglycan interpeptide bridge formation enzyme)
MTQSKKSEFNAQIGEILMEYEIFISNLLKTMMNPIKSGLSS